jgi:lysophospholipid acyltransferase
MIRNALAAWAVAQGIEPDSLFSALAMGVNILLTLGVYNRLSSPLARNLFSIAVSCITFAVLFQWQDLLQLTALSLVCYYLTAALAHKPLGPVLVFTLSLGYLAVNHLYKQVYPLVADEDAKMDYTAPLMVLVMKLSTYAWSMHDGTRPEASLSPAQRATAIRFSPGLLDFLGFVFYFPAFLVGPSFEFLDYHQFVRNAGVFSRRTMPSPWPAFWRTLGIAVAVLCVHLRFAHISYHSMAEPAFIAAHPFWYRYVHVLACLLSIDSSQHATIDSSTLTPPRSCSAPSS